MIYLSEEEIKRIKYIKTKGDFFETRLIIKMYYNNNTIFGRILNFFEKEKTIEVIYPNDIKDERGDKVSYTSDGLIRNYNYIIKKMDELKSIKN